MLFDVNSHDFFLLLWQNLDIFEQKNHDTSVILEYFLKNIGIYNTLLSWSFFQKTIQKQQAYYSVQMVFPAHLYMYENFS